jgi:hypothetical protein
MIGIKFFGTPHIELQELLVQDLFIQGISRNRDVEIYFDQARFDSQGSAFRVLILLEPPSVMPENYVQSSLVKFDLVIPLSPWRADNMGLGKFAFQPIAEPSVLPRSTYKEKSLVFVNALKFGAVNTSLYGWRLKILREAERAEVPIDVYGPNWDMSYFMEIRKRIAATRRALNSVERKTSEAWTNLFYRPKNYKGQTENKYRTISKYQFMLVVENDLYSLTEKIFDALYSGAIVFYRGPRLKSHTNLEQFCYELPENIEDALAFMKEIISLPDFRLIDIKERLSANPRFFAPFTFQETSQSLASIIVSELQSHEI